MSFRLVSSKYLNNFNRVYDSNLCLSHNSSHSTDKLSQDQQNSTDESNFETEEEYCECEGPVNFENLSSNFHHPDKITILRVQNETADVKKYNIASYINTYQITQNTFLPALEFERQYLSDSVCIYPSCMQERISKIVPVIATCNGEIDAIETFFSSKYSPDSADVNTVNINSHINNVYHLIDPPIKVRKGDKLDVMVFCNKGEAMKIVIDTND